MNDFEFSVHTLCLMDKENLVKMLQEKHSNTGFSIEAIKEALRVYDSDDYKSLREELQREVYKRANPVIVGESVAGKSF